MSYILTMLKPYWLQMNTNQESDDPSRETEGNVITETRPPKMYRVVLLNDDFTPMDFVVYVLLRFFGKSQTDAEKIMLAVHHKGAGTAGIFTREIAETKTHQVNQFSKQNDYPLKTMMEPE